MTLVRKFLLGAVPTVAAGGTGVGVFIYEKTKTPAPAPKKINPDLELIKRAGLDCGEIKEWGECSILSGGLNLEVSKAIKENLVLSGSEKGKIMVRMDTKRKGNVRLVVGKGDIQLKDGSETTTMERYENYVLAEKGGKVYLQKVMTVDKGKIKVLGLPDAYNLPTTVKKEGDSFVIEKSLVWYIRFEGFTDVKRATSKNKMDLNLKTYKIDNSQTFKGGYRFSFQPASDITMPLGDTLDKDIWWDFRIKNPDEDDIVLERVWKNESDLLGAVGLTCTGEDCEISSGGLNVKKGDVKNKGLTKEGEGGSGKMKVYKKRTGHYEGLRFEIKEGDINLGSSQKLEEMEVYEILRDEEDDSYYLTRKHEAKEVIIFLLGLGKCTLPETGKSTTCTIESKDLGNLKVYEGETEQTVSGSGTLTVTITTETEEANYPFGYKFSLSPTGEVKMGDSVLDGTSSHEFKIKKGESKLYLEKV